MTYQELIEQCGLPDGVPATTPCVIRLEKDPVDESVIPELEKALGVKMGPQLREIVLNYSHFSMYIEYVDCDFESEPVYMDDVYSIKKGQEVSDSDLVRYTVFLRELSEDGPLKLQKLLNNMIVISGSGDNIHYLVDSEDNVYSYLPFKYMENENKKLFDFLVDSCESNKALFYTLDKLCVEHNYDYDKIYEPVVIMTEVINVIYSGKVEKMHEEIFDKVKAGLSEKALLTKLYQMSREYKRKYIKDHQEKVTICGGCKGWDWDEDEDEEED